MHFSSYIISTRILKSFSLCAMLGKELWMDEARLITKNKFVCQIWHFIKVYISHKAFRLLKFNYYNQGFLTFQLPFGILTIITMVRISTGRRNNWTRMLVENPRTIMLEPTLFRSIIIIIDAEFVLKQEGVPWITLGVFPPSALRISSSSFNLRMLSFTTSVPFGCSASVTPRNCEWIIQYKIQFSAYYKAHLVFSSNKMQIHRASGNRNS